MEAYTVQVDEQGTRRYYNSQGLLHRESGPAVEYADGSQMWYQAGRLHREAGPAFEFADGTGVWYLDGVGMSEAEFLTQTQRQEVTVAELEKH